ncbi:DUF4267 domain-containing protein [Nocardia sp. NPDC127526]|uniref:DUF4267 domain-containing protein n=1 Tax=Nocardia sp. NPDC127526 TaxID=3345393 RepID=UPI00363F065A
MRNPIFLTLNIFATVLTMAVSILILIDPAFALPADTEVTTGVTTFARACSIRSLAVGAALLLALARHSRATAITLLYATAVIQAGDATVHLLNANPASAAATTLAALALTSAHWLTRRPE